MITLVDIKIYESFLFVLGFFFLESQNIVRSSNTNFFIPPHSLNILDECVYQFGTKLNIIFKLLQHYQNLRCGNNVQSLFAKV